MATSINSLIIDLRQEYGDDLPEDEQSLSAEHLRRSIQRAAVIINRDFGTEYKFQTDDMIPSPTSNDREMLLLAAMVSVAEMMLARHARYPSVKSGDKSVSHSDQVDAWSRLHVRFLDQYKDSVAVQKARELDNVEPQLYG